MNMAKITALEKCMVKFNLKNGNKLRDKLLSRISGHMDDSIELYNEKSKSM